MDEDAPSLVVALILNIIIFIVIPFVMAYRRGYFFNMDEHLNWIKELFKHKNQYLPTEWTVTGIRQLSAFEKHQIHKIVVKFMPENGDGYWAFLTLKSGKRVKYRLCENKFLGIDDEIHKNNILIRKWQKGINYKYDVIPLK